MSALRQSRPPVPPMSGDVANALSATPPNRPGAITPEAAPLSAAAAAKPRRQQKASAPAKGRVAQVDAHRNAKGARITCHVKIGSGRCANPGRHEAKRGVYICSTHELSRGKGRSLTYVTAQTSWVSTIKRATASA